MYTIHPRQPMLLFVTLLTLIGFIGTLPVSAESVTTAFTYQGQLFFDGTAVGANASETCDFTFALFDAATGGGQIGSTLTHAITVTDSYFTVELDFGANIFQGAARYLEITVDCPSGGAAPLNERVKLTAAPYALYALEAATATNTWNRTGNAGTTPDTNFVGTTDNQPLELRVNSSRVLRLEQATAIISGETVNGTNTIGGFNGNMVTAGVAGATIAGGGLNATLASLGGPNIVTDTGGTIGGGVQNQAGNNAGTTADAFYATVSGGRINEASGPSATVGGGEQNSASGSVAAVGGGARNRASDVGTTVSGGRVNEATIRYATVGGGTTNKATNTAATVGGGAQNTASGQYATVPGGVSNRATGNYSFAAGWWAIADDDGAFVWADSRFDDVKSPGADTFSVSAQGGIWFGRTTTPSIPDGRFINTSTNAHLTTGGMWINNSDRNKKTALHPVNPRTVLEQVAALPISTWRYQADADTIRHMGPMAQDFYTAFGLGESNTAIGTVDADGVALAAIQGLHTLLLEKDAKIADLEAENERLEQRLTDIEARLTVLEGE